MYSPNQKIEAIEISVVRDAAKSEKIVRLEDIEIYMIITLMLRSY